MREASTYSHTDIQRYLQKKMSPQEMHEFERALMDDPFLADALEGYRESDATVASQHLQQIEGLLQNDKESAKVVALPAKKTSWWKVAAAVLLIGSVGVLTYSLFSKDHSLQSGLAKQGVQKNKENIAAAALKQDSTLAANPPVARLDDSKDELLRKAQSYAPSVSDNTQPAAASGTTVVQADKVDETKDAAKSAAPAYYDTGAHKAPQPTAEEADTKTLRQMAKSENEFKGKVVDVSGEPVAFATVRAKDKQVATDAEGKFTLKAPDSMIKVEVASLGYANASTEIKASTLNNITLRQNDQSLSEVVVTGMRRKRGKEVAAAASKASLQAEPQGGWQNFNQYLNNKVDSLRVLENNSNSGNNSTSNSNSNSQDVVLEFSIDNDGNPQNIKPQNKVDKETAEKAKQILLNGPKWTNNSNKKKVKVTIPVQ